MKENKTKQNEASVYEFLAQVEPEQKKKDSHQLLELLGKITKATPKMWGASIVGFGQYHYKYKSGREGDWFLSGFSPRKNALTLYLMCDLSHEKLDFENLGKYKKSKGCLYIKKLDDIDTAVLQKIIVQSIELTKEMYS